MALIGNTLVFLETNFFVSYKPISQEHRDFLKYSQDEKIALCTSYICLREWRHQVVGGLKGYRDRVQQLYSDKKRDNILANELLDKHSPYYLSDEEIEKASVDIIEKFLKDNKIRIYNPTEDHIERTFDAYFKGDPPYTKQIERQDIPDSWIFEAAKDARFDDENKKYGNKFSIGNDKGLNDHLEGLGLKPTTKHDLLEQLKREEDKLAAGIKETKERPVKTLVVPTEVKIDSGLEGVLSSANTPEIREIYIRLLGYTHWLSGPAKQDLFSIIEGKGFSLQLIEASATILSQDSLELLEDTGNHLLPKNKDVCEEAASLIMEEILEILD